MSSELDSYEKFDGVGLPAETIETRARIGERFLECYASALQDPLLSRFTPADCPSEIVLDLVERLSETTAQVAQLQGRQTVLMVDQYGVTVGAERVSFEELHRREVHRDMDGTVWTPPTAWAYMQTCRALHQLRADPLRIDAVAALYAATKRLSDNIAEFGTITDGEFVDDLDRALEEIRAGRSPASLQEVTLTEIHPAPTEFSPEQLAQDNILRYFHYAHLPATLQAASKPFCDLARHIVDTLPRNPERTVALRKLLEAKDAGVRANVQ